MLFNSPLFIFAFLPFTLILYFLSKNIHKKAPIFLLILASLVFYGYWEPKYLFIIISSILVNFFIGKNLSTRPNKKTLALGVSLNLLALIYYKYTNFLIDNFNLLFGSNVSIENIILPLAISFFTFQQIAFLVDSYYGKTKEYRFENYVLFVAFFPQLIAGPIVHHKEVLPQFSKNSVFNINYQNILLGLGLFTIGLFKKVVIADELSLYANKIFALDFSQAQDLNILTSWAAALSYTFQLYFDFSGYSDMAIGLAKMFNINLPFNFNSPYKAKSISEFWRRWHMTLSHFLKDYLYIPLGGNRVRKFKNYRNLMLTMLLGGIWHGAGWNFAIWGLLHGVLLAINHFWRNLNIASLKNIPFLNSAFTLITMVFVVIGWVFFRSETLEGALVISRTMFDINWLFNNSISYTLYKEIGGSTVNKIVILLFVVKFAPNAQEIIFKSTHDRLRLRLDNYLFMSLLGAVLAYTLYTIIYKVNIVYEFLYYDF